MNCYKRSVNLQINAVKSRVLTRVTIIIKSGFGVCLYIRRVSKRYVLLWQTLNQEIHIIAKKFQIFSKETSYELKNCC